MEASYIAVVGGVNVDICGVPDTGFVPGDSNPGRITVTAGGVGRNVAENLARMGLNVRMITALGDDGNAALVRSSCESVGIDLSDSLTIKGAQTSCYLCLGDTDGELIGAVSDMDIYKSISPFALEDKLDMLNGAVLVVLDANLPPETVRWLCEHIRVPIFADPVSIKKAAAFKESLSALALIKPNRAEASLLCGVDIRSHDDLPKAAEAFFALGLKRVIISLGCEGVYFHDGAESGILPCFRSPIVNTTGCGDAFLAAAAAAYLTGKSLREIAVCGLAASAICAQTDSAVNPAISEALIHHYVNEYPTTKQEE